MIYTFNLKKGGFILVLLFAYLISFGSNIKPINFQFYHQSIELKIIDSNLVLPDLLLSENEIKTQYLTLKSDEFQSLLQQLHRYKKELKLNDWLFYELIFQSLEHSFPSLSRNNREIISWYLLNESGFDTRLSYLHNRLWIYTYTDEEMYEVSMIQDEGKMFVNLTEIRLKEDKFENEVYLLDFKPSKGSKTFSFNLKTLPSFKIKSKTVSFDFKYFERDVQLTFEIDLAIIELMNIYPFISEQDYLKVPFSATTLRTLVPLLKQELATLSEKEKLEFLVSFTRKAFKYKEDHETFGKSKPMIAEEVFFHQYSDCEDRCALFYNLCKEILDIPMLVIALPDHLTIAVAAQENLGQAIRYKGKSYYICDPTGPFNTSRIGNLPKEYQNSAYQILDYYQ